MNQEIYEKYAKYYIDKFADVPGIRIVKKWINDHILHIYVETDLSFEFFMGIFDDMLTFDGICVCDHGIDYDNIETVNPRTVYKFIDKEAALIKKYIREGVFMFAFDKEGKRVASQSCSVINRKRFLKTFNIKDFYYREGLSHYPKFEELSRIEIKDFYNQIIYAYDIDKTKEINNIDEFLSKCK